MIPRSDDYLKFMRGEPCCVPSCKVLTSVPHHAGRKYKAIKPSDFSTVPLCDPHHGELHQDGVLTFQSRYDVSFVRVMAEKMHKFLTGERLELPVRV